MWRNAVVMYVVSFWFECVLAWLFAGGGHFYDFYMRSATPLHVFLILGSLLAFKPPSPSLRDPPVSFPKSPSILTPPLFPEPRSPTSSQNWSGLGLFGFSEACYRPHVPTGTLLIPERQPGDRRDDLEWHRSPYPGSGLEVVAPPVRLRVG